MASLDFSPLDNALKQLASGLMEAGKEGSGDLQRDGVIQRFEYSHELAIKFIKRVLETRHNDPVDTLAYNDLLRTAFERGYIKNVEHWFDYRKARNQTSHTYDASVAGLVFNSATPFLEDAQFLLARLVATAD
jgi:nucleotidyltransferase substrate binding protein (TIGR01987 family)